jgi:hypothetical protein
MGRITPDPQGWERESRTQTAAPAHPCARGIQGILPIKQQSPAMRGLVVKLKNGALGEIRTPDPLVRSQVLYPAELRAHILKMILAEREGFEPSIGDKPYTPLAGARLRPLGHLSGTLRPGMPGSRSCRGVTAARGAILAARWAKVKDNLCGVRCGAPGQARTRRRA